MPAIRDDRGEEDALHSAPDIVERIPSRRPPRAATPRAPSSAARGSSATTGTTCHQQQEAACRAHAPTEKMANAKTQLIRGAGVEAEPVAGWVVVVKGPGRGAFRPVYVGMNSVGRDPSQRVSLSFGDESISREEHAFITYDEEQRCFYLQHGGKSNLVRLGADPVLTPRRAQAERSHSHRQDHADVRRLLRSRLLLERRGPGRMSIVLASAARATTGARSGQEDAFQLWPADGVARPNGEEGGGLLAVLADGMGGHTGGAVAGQTACSTFAEVFSAATSALRPAPPVRAGRQQRGARQGRRGERRPARHGLHHRRRLDRRARHPLGQRRRLAPAALPLSRRHPPQCRPFAGLVPGRAGAPEPHHASEAKQHHNRNALRSALTGAKIDLIDLRSEPLELQVGDWILIASDGICSLEGDEIADVVYNFRQSTPAEMADGLIAAVVRKAVAGQDNTTVVAIRVDPAKAAGDVETTRVLRGRAARRRRSFAPAASAGRAARPRSPAALRAGPSGPRSGWWRPRSSCCSSPPRSCCGRCNRRPS